MSSCANFIALVSARTTCSSNGRLLASVARLVVITWYGTSRYSGSSPVIGSAMIWPMPRVTAILVNGDMKAKPSVLPACIAATIGAPMPIGCNCTSRDGSSAANQHDGAHEFVRAGAG